MTDPEEEFETMADVPADQPAGVTRVEVSVPTPTLEQVAGEMARQVLREQPYDRPSLRQLAQERLEQAIDAAVTDQVKARIEELLANPLQRTDAFGQPVGEPVSLAAILNERVTSWATDLVNAQGLAADKNGYGYREAVPRIEWLLKQVASSELQSAVSKEVERIKAELKAAATQGIAKQIAEKVAGMVLK